MFSKAKANPNRVVVFGVYHYFNSYFIQIPPNSYPFQRDRSLNHRSLLLCWFISILLRFFYLCVSLTIMFISCHCTWNLETSWWQNSVSVIIFSHYTLTTFAIPVACYQFGCSRNNASVKFAIHGKSFTYFFSHAIKSSNWLVKTGHMVHNVQMPWINGTSSLGSLFIFIIS